MTYYRSDELIGKANVILSMLVLNMLIQLLCVLGQYQKKSWGVKCREAMICLIFMRPAVDAYRVATSHADDDKAMDSLLEMMLFKGIGE